MVLVLVMVGSPPSMRGFEAGLVDIVREGELRVDGTLERFGSGVVMKFSV
jgi:hypothetical protein